MRRGYDAVVAGLGAMGSSVAYHLARSGARVLGLDRFTPPHAHGSSHGESRIIREAYFEDPVYVPLVQRAYTLWDELEAEVGERLLRRTGALMVGAPESELVTGAVRSARQHALAYERLDADEIRRRFPAFGPDPEVAGVYEARAGILNPEGCVAAHLRAARGRGAELRFDEPVAGWEVDGGGVTVTTSRGRYRAETLVLCLGPWLPGLVPGVPLEVERQVMLWFRPAARPEVFSPERCPVFLWETEPKQLFYGIPDLGAGVKAARHHGGEVGRVGDLDDAVRAEDVAAVRAFLRRHLPALDGDPIRGAVCRYTNTPSRHFLVDRHPDTARAWVVSPCSGHGFKFASVIGEAVGELVTRGETRHDLSRFGLQRVS